MKKIYLITLVASLFFGCVVGCSDDSASSPRVPDDIIETPDAGDITPSPDADESCEQDSDCIDGPRQVAVCDTVLGQCQYACDRGYANCDGDYATGCEVKLDEDIEHCGACGQACHPGRKAWQPVCAPDNEGEPRCGEIENECAEGYVDLDGDPQNGCECKISSTEDLPDPDGLDANCDGIDGTLEDAVYVDVDAAPLEDGSDPHGLTPDQPVTSIMEGLRIAAEQSRRYVLVAKGTYDETIELRAGIGIYGGYTNTPAEDDAVATWTRNARDGIDASLTVIAPQDVDDPSSESAQTYRTLLGKDINRATTVSDLTIVGSDVTQSGSSTAGVWLRNSDGLKFHNIVISAGQAADGRAGDPGEPGSSGSCGNDNIGGRGGADTVATPCNIPPPSNPDEPSEPPKAESGTDGRPLPEENTGSGLGGYGGAGGTHACVSNRSACGNLNGVAGTRGHSGDKGRDGKAANSSYGLLSAREWTPSAADEAEVGVDGGGGGGGGAGGRCEGDNIVDNEVLRGGNGGAGGQGGCGGQRGENGQSGGASIGLALINSSITATDVAIRLGNAGHGGKGGLGGAGHNGHDGEDGEEGKKGKLSLESILYNASGGDGGDGASGGTGGDGGDGAGGCGGPSLGVATRDSIIDLTGLAITTSTGRAGDPGAGAQGSSAPRGCDGDLRATYDFSNPD